MVHFYIASIFVWRGRLKIKGANKMTKEEYRKRLIRHGELLLIPINELPANLEQTFVGERYIVAHSETGHHHVAVADAPNALTVFRPIGADSPDLYLKVSAPSKIEHQKDFDKHETKTIPEGIYLCRPKSEYDPFAKIIQQVRD
jgi:hypothetical protein